jgi:glycosyltransferase involved in cell wall biosynthesis
LKENDNSNVDYQVLKKYCHTIKVFEYSKLRHVVNTAFGLLTNTLPMQVNYYYFNEVQRYIDRLLKENIYELVYAFHIRTTKYLENYLGTKVVDLVDSVALNYHKAKHKASGLWKLIYYIEAKRVGDYEVFAAQKFDKVFLTSIIDKNFIGNTKIEVIGNFVQIKPFDQPEYQNGLVSFLGKMDYEPNVNAVKFFVKDVLFRLKKNVPDVFFRVIGAFPTSDILNFNHIEGVEVTGYVNDPYYLLAQSHVVVAPMVSGAGIQNKILEAMYLGKCVVTTKIGAEGLANLKGDELIVCEDTNDLIVVLSLLLKDYEKCKEIGEKAKEYVCTYYSFDVIQDKFAQVFEWNKKSSLVNQEIYQSIDQPPLMTE